MAAQLIRYGIDFVLIDKKEGPTHLSKALVVHARTLEIYNQIGLARKAVDQGVITQQVALLHDGRISAEINFADIGKRLSPFPFMLMFEQSKNKQWLYEHLRQNNRAVQWQTELKSLKQQESGVEAIITSATGETQTVEAQYLVGCDGASSPTRHLMGLGFEGPTHPKLFYVADVDLNFSAGKAPIYAAFRHESFLLMFPIEGQNHWRLIDNIPEFNEQADQETTYDDMEAKARYVMQQPLDITNVRWFSSYKVHTRHGERFSVGRCFLAGEATHIHTPAGDQGMNTGIQDAYNLAWKLAFVLKKQASPTVLESYNEEHLANAKHLLKTTDQFFAVAVGNN